MTYRKPTINGKKEFPRDAQSIAYRETRWGKQEGGGTGARLMEILSRIERVYATKVKMFTGLTPQGCILVTHTLRSGKKDLGIRVRGRGVVKKKKGNKFRTRVPDDQKVPEAVLHSIVVPF